MGTGKLVDFRQLEVWKKAHVLTLGVYSLTKNFPTEERYGLVQQMRKSAVSVPANVAEGFKKKSKRDKINFYNIAQGSLEELRYYFLLSKDLNYYSQNFDELWALSEEIGRMLTGLIKATGKI